MPCPWSPAGQGFCIHGDHSKMTDCVVEKTCQYVSGHYMVSPNQAGRVRICNAVTGLRGLAPAMGYFPMVVADGGRIHRTMPSLPYMECIIKVLLRVAIFSPAYFRVRISPLPPEFNVDTLGPEKNSPPSPSIPTLNSGGRGGTVESTT